MPKTRKICALSMLIALTVTLSYVSGFLRMGNISKISLSFITVYLASAAFGPISGGIVAACADFISYIVNPTGPLLWQITLMEFFYGVLYGFMFCGDFADKKRNSFHPGKLTVFVMIRFLVDITVKTFVLVKSGLIVNSFYGAAAMRLPSVAFMAVIQIVIILLINRFSKKLISVIRGSYEKS